jgi:hypothetical protein
MIPEPGMSLKGRVALAVWGVGVLVVLRVAVDVLRITGARLAAVGVAVAVGSFYGVFMPLWRRLPEDVRRG